MYLANFLNDKTTNEVIYRMNFDNKKKLYHCTECELNILNGKINDAIRTGKALRKKSNASN